MVSHLFMQRTAFFWMAASYSLAWLSWHVQYLVPRWWMFSSFPINCSHTQTIFVLTSCAQCKDIHWVNSKRWSGRDRGHEHLQYWQFSYPSLRLPQFVLPPAESESWLPHQHWALPSELAGGKQNQCRFVVRFCFQSSASFHLFEFNSISFYVNSRIIPSIPYPPLLPLLDHVVRLSFIRALYEINSLS